LIDALASGGKLVSGIGVEDDLSRMRQLGIYPET
jgi:hypothetical protein